MELFLGTNGLAEDPTENGDNIVAIVKDIHEDRSDTADLSGTHDLSCQSGWYRFLE